MNVLDRFLDECAACASDTPPPALRAATSAFLEWVGTQPSGAPPAALDALSRLPPRGASWLAITLGSAVEGGAPVDESARAVTELLRAWLERLPLDDPEQDLDDPQHELVLAMPYLCQSVVAHLARSPVLREALASETELLRRLHAAEQLSYGAAWVRELLRRSSGELVAIHVESRRAIALSYENVGSAFQLFTLLQGAIGRRLPGGQAPIPAMLAAARGGEPTEARDESWWHYQDPTLPVSSILHSIWPELTVRDLPKLDGVAVLVLWPKIVGGRYWGADLFGPPLEAAPPSVTLARELPSTEAERWLARIGIGTP